MAETMVASSIKNDHSSRKNKKPLMEKKRRARINSCLTQLKSLVLQAIKKDSSQFSKLEKADILELTVKHLRALQRQQAAGVMAQDSNVVSKYRAGFNECAKEVVRYMGSVREVNEEVKERVVGHLASCLQVVNQMTPMESMQQQMKPLHVHIPPQQPINGGVTNVAPSVIMHTAAVSQHSGPSGLAYTPSPLASSSSPSDAGQTPSPVSATPLSALPLQSVAMTTAHSTIVSPTTSAVSGAFKLVPSGAGTVAVYVGTSNSMPCAPDTVSVDAVPLYSVSLPPHPADTALAAYIASPITSHMISPSSSDSRYQDVSPVKAEYTPLTVASLPVDLRQSQVKAKAMDQCAAFSPLTSAPCSHSGLHEDKLWRPW